MPIDAILLEVSWKVPNLFVWPVGLVILAWAFGAGFLAFTGSQASGQPDIHPPPRAPESAEQAVEQPAEDAETASE